MDGWVRNLADGSVSAAAVGPAEAVEALIAACREGPPLARVVEIISEDMTAAERENLIGGGFLIR